MKAPTIKVGDRAILSTTDYKIFKGMEGNRDVDQRHVRQLQKLMLENGNLTYEFPIIVNKDMLVVDGQHRLQALEGLGWEVGYTIQDEASIATVRAINRGNRNWSWLDIASSYAKLGSKEYEWFLWYAKTYSLTFKAALGFAGFGDNKSTARQKFHNGELEIKDKTKAVEIAEQYREISDACEQDNSALSLAFMAIQKSPFYNHERMVIKMTELGTSVPQAAAKSEYMRKFEEIFNHKLHEDNKVRFF